MICRSNKYFNYIGKRYGNGITIYKDGENKPLKPVKSNYKTPVFALYINGNREYVSIFEFLLTCIDDLNLKLN